MKNRPRRLSMIVVYDVTAAESLKIYLNIIKISGQKGP